MSFTVNNFASALIAGANSGSVTISVSSGHTVVVVISERNFIGLAAGTITDSAGNTYTPGTFTSGAGQFMGMSATALAIASPITSVTYTTGTPGTNAFFIDVWDITATGTIAIADTKGVVNTSSVTGTDGVSFGSMAITGSDALIMAATKDWSSGIVTAGTGFTAESGSQDFAEHRAVTGSAAATFTFALAGDTYTGAAVALQIAGGGGGNTASIAWVT